MQTPVPKDVKESIIVQSTRLFLANGFRGTSVKQITEAVGIGRGTLYWYFKSKEEILEVIFRKFEKEMVDGFIEAVRKRDGGFVPKFKAFHKFSTEFARDNRDLSLAFNSLLTEIIGANTEGEKIAREIWEKYRKSIKSLLEQGEKEGYVEKRIDTGLYAHLIVANQTGILVQWFVYGDHLDARGLVKTFEKFLLDGIISKES